MIISLLKTLLQKISVVLENTNFKTTKDAPLSSLLSSSSSESFGGAVFLIDAALAFATAFTGT